MPTFYPLRASTLRYDDLSTKRGYSGEDPYEICDKKANPRLLYIVLSFGAVSSNHSFRSHHSCLCHAHLHKSHLFFVPYYFLYNRLSDPYLFSLSLERFPLRITLRKPSKDPQRVFSPSPLPRGIGHAALSYSLAAANLFCA